MTAVTERQLLNLKAAVRQWASISLSFLSIHPLFVSLSNIPSDTDSGHLFVNSKCVPRPYGWLYAAIIGHLLLRVLLLHHRPADVFKGQRHRDCFCPIELPEPFNHYKCRCECAKQRLLLQVQWLSPLYAKRPQTQSSKRMENCAPQTHTMHSELLKPNKARAHLFIVFQRIFL